MFYSLAAYKMGTEERLRAEEDADQVRRRQAQRRKLKNN